MIFSLLIQTSPQNLTTAVTALEFAKALVRRQHKIHRLFFYGDGVTIANQNPVIPQDEPDIYAAWRAFIAEQKIDSVVCIASALKRGIIDAAEGKRYQRDAITLPAEYSLSGLGQLIDAAVVSDKIVTFA